MSTVLAIDFGNENLVISTPRKGGIDIINNQSSQRQTPSMVAFSDTRRYAGEFARQQQMMNIKGTITNLKRLIGLKYETEERKMIEKVVPYKIVKMEDGFIGVEVSYLDKPTTFSVEQCVSLLLKEVFAIASHHGISSKTTKDCVISVSPSWGEVERRIILDSAKIAGFNVLKLLNSTTAASITYSMYNRKRLPESIEKAVPIAFVDFGDSELNVSIVSMSQGSIEVKGVACDKKLGGSDFTTALVNLLLEKTKNKYKIDPSQNPRSMLRFRQAAEKLKKSLSINSIMPFDVQSCMNDIDVSFMVKREEFEEVIVDLVDRIEQPVLKALEIADVKKEDLFAIEIIGGASRVKVVKEKFRSIFGKDFTQSLNPDECFAIGAGFQAAILSPQFKVDLKVRDIAMNPVMIEWKDENGEVKKNELFKQYNSIPCTKIVPIKVKENCNVRIYNDQIGDIGIVKIETGTEDIINAKLKVRLSSDGIIQFVETTHQVTEEVEDKEGKKKTIKSEIPLPFTFKPRYGLSLDQIENLKSEEKKMLKRDQEEIEIDNIKNELSSYIFTLNNYIVRDYPEFFDPSKKDEYLQKINDAQCWFDENEFDRLPLKDYQDQLSILKEIGEKAMNRKNDRIEIPKQINEFIRLAEIQGKKLNNKEEKYSHISEDERNIIRKEINDFTSLMKNKFDEIEKTPKFIDLQFNKSDTQTKLNSLEAKVQNLFMKPKPTVIKNEEKTENEIKEHHATEKYK